MTWKNSLNITEREKEREQFETLKKYDKWKANREKVREKREGNIALISWILGLLLAYLVVWAILRVNIADTWTLGKGIFVSEEKLAENWPKVEAIDNKVKKGIVAKPLNWLSKKVEEGTTKDFLRGDLGAFAKAMRLYSGILLVIWFISVVIFWTIFYHLNSWIISKFIWKKTDSSEEEI